MIENIYGHSRDFSSWRTVKRKQQLSAAMQRKLISSLVLHISEAALSSNFVFHLVSIFFILFISSFLLLLPVDSGTVPNVCWLFLCCVSCPQLS